MACCRLQVSRGRKIKLFILFIPILLTACQTLQPQPLYLVGDLPKQPLYTKPYFQPFSVPILSRVGFVRSPSQPIPAAERDLLDCQTTPDNQQICSARPVSRLLRSR